MDEILEMRDICKELVNYTKEYLKINSEFKETDEITKITNSDIDKIDNSIELYKIIKDCYKYLYIYLIDEYLATPKPTLEEIKNRFNIGKIKEEQENLEQYFKNRLKDSN
jgi:hypothetical protein